MGKQRVSHIHARARTTDLILFYYVLLLLLLLLQYVLQSYTLEFINVINCAHHNILSEEKCINKKRDFMAFSHDCITQSADGLSVRVCKSLPPAMPLCVANAQRPCSVEMGVTCKPA